MKMSTAYEHVKTYRHRRKANVVYVMGGKCCLCGYDKCLAALELHHIDPNEKEFDFHNLNMSWDKTQIELQKCILVCSNCHREVHAGLIEQELKTSFNPQRAEEITEALSEWKTATVNVCPDCGAPVSEKGVRCVECGNKQRRVVKERPTREELKNLIRTTPFIQIGKMYGISDNAIRKWCKKYDLPAKSSEIKLYSDEEWLKI